jgi:hypothetical protein
MTDFIDELVSGLAPVEMEFSFNGKTGKAFFKRITGAQKLQLVKGRKYKYDTTAGASQIVDVDLEDNERNQHQVILFCVCKEDGSNRFKRIEDVQNLDAGLLSALYDVANRVNRGAGEEESPGES